MKTANGKYDYDTVHYGFKLIDYANLMLDLTSEEFNDKKKNATYGSVKCDSLINGIGNVFAKCDGNSKLSDIAEALHEGFGDNHKYWRDNEPWSKFDYYNTPYKFMFIWDERYSGKFTELSEKASNYKRRVELIAKTLRSFLI